MPHCPFTYLLLLDGCRQLQGLAGLGLQLRPVLRNVPPLLASEKNGGRRVRRVGIRGGGGGRRTADGGRRAAAACGRVAATAAAAVLYAACMGRLSPPRQPGHKASHKPQPGGCCSHAPVEQVWCGVCLTPADLPTQTMCHPLPPQTPAPASSAPSPRPPPPAPQPTTSCCRPATRCRCMVACSWERLTSATFFCSRCAATARRCASSSASRCCFRPPASLPCGRGYLGVGWWWWLACVREGAAGGGGAGRGRGRGSTGCSAPLLQAMHASSAMTCAGEAAVPLASERGGGGGTRGHGHRQVPRTQGQAWGSLVRS